MIKAKYKFIVFLLFILIFSTACKSPATNVGQMMQPVTLNWWGVFHNQGDVSDIISAYKARHPHVTIKYRKLRYEEFENELLHALAEDRGPDILSLHHSWLKKYQSKLSPIPTETKMVFMVQSGSIKKEVIPELRTKKSITLQGLKDQFVDVVYSDVVLDAKIYALPLSVDTLALYFNRDLFDQAKIIDVPLYWNRYFQETVKNLTILDPRYNILQSGIAMGGAENIERAFDILSVLMMQNGSEMMIGDRVTFHQTPSNLATKDYNPGLEALRFYIDFASSNKEVYSWNEDLPNSIEMFAQGKLAMVFAYSYHLPQIRALAPKLNFGISPLPQIENSPKEINYANYWVEAVAQKSKHQNEAWDFLQFATSANQVKTYLNKTNKPTALRSLINEQLEENEEIEVFINQALTARTWYKGSNSLAAEEAIINMIQEANLGINPLMNVLNSAALKVSQTIN
jgi:multiple sugar transport system substrate-binding protein